MSTKRETPMSDRTLAFLEGITKRKLTISNLLLAIREGEEMTQKDFAKLLGVSAQYLCDVEHGRKIVTAKSAAIFAKKLGRPPLIFVRLALQDEIRKAGLKFEVDLKAA
jgi:transcriptional regulator with XRE-family HTH domain